MQFPHRPRKSAVPFPGSPGFCFSLYESARGGSSTAGLFTIVTHLGRYGERLVCGTPQCSDQSVGLQGLESYGDGQQTNRGDIQALALVFESLVENSLESDSVRRRRAVAKR